MPCTIRILTPSSLEAAPYTAEFHGDKRHGVLLVRWLVTDKKRERVGFHTLSGVT